MPTRLWVLAVSCVLLSLSTACTASDDLDPSADSTAQLEPTSAEDSEPGDTDTDGDQDISQRPVSGNAGPYRADELRLGVKGLIDTSDDVDQLMLGVFEGQLLSREASVDRFVSRVQALEPAVIACLENDAGLKGDMAQLFAQALLSEAFGIEGPDDSIVVAFPDVVWEEIGPANPEAEIAADASGCVEAATEESGGVFAGPVGQRYFDLLRAGEWQTPDGFEDSFEQAITDNCGPEPFEECEDEDSVAVQMLPFYREAIGLNLDKLG